MIDRHLARRRLRVGTSLIACISFFGVAFLGSPSFAAKGAAEVAERYVEAYRSADTDTMLAVYADDATFIDVSQQKEVTGKDALRQMLATLTIVHSAMDIEVKRSLDEGATAILEVVYTGTVDPAQMGRTDIGPISYAIAAVLIFETEGGLIERQIDYLDFRALSELMAKLQPPAAG